MYLWEVFMSPLSMLTRDSGVYHWGVMYEDPVTRFDRCWHNTINDPAFENHPGFCVEQLVKYPDGTVSGDTIFVKTNCADRPPLPPDQQDPAYNHPGVPIDRNELQAIFKLMGEKQGDTVTFTNPDLPPT